MRLNLGSLKKEKKEKSEQLAKMKTTEWVSYLTTQCSFIRSSSHEVQHIQSIVDT